jgi:antitoxin YefM
MRTEPLATVKAQLSALVDEVVKTQEALTVTRNGVPAVVILAAEDYENLLETLEWMKHYAGDSIAALRQEEDEAYERGDYFSTEQLKAEMAERRRASGAA